ncbi:transporter [Candidatus Deferrimicrobium sp.]|uniref:transporter n=1 Tax=Candidatus Deferrimicrobium sp. TaxID=3060586 RepID=UPI002ED10629
MRKTISVPLLAALLLGAAGTPSFAFNQPPLNLGLTDILDGALPGPGNYFTEYIQAYQSDKFKDRDVGPAISWAASPNIFLGLKTQWETSAENRTEGNRTTFRFTYKF